MINYGTKLGTPAVLDTHSDLNDQEQAEDAVVDELPAAADDSEEGFNTAEDGEVVSAKVALMTVVDEVVEAAAEPLSEKQHIADTQGQHDVVRHLASLRVEYVEQGDDEDAQEAHRTDCQEGVHIDLLHNEFVGVVGGCIIEGVRGIGVVGWLLRSRSYQ